MNNKNIVTTTSCTNCNNEGWRNRRNFETPGWGPGPNPGPYRRAEPWGPPYPGPFHPAYWGGSGSPRLEPWPRPYNPRPDGPRPDPWEFRPYQPGLGPGEPGPRPYRY